MKKRVVVTGIGVVSPIGVGINENWERYLSGKSGITEFETEDVNTKTYAGKVPDGELETFIPEGKKDKIDKFTSFALVAAKIALHDAKIGEGFDKEKIGVFLGSAFSGFNIIEKQIKILYTEGPRRVHPLLMQNNLTNAPSGEVAIEFTLKGPNIGFSCGACSGNYSIIHAFNTIQRHDVDAMVAGGTEAPLSSMILEGLRQKGLFKSNNHGLTRASCPFDIDRKGFVLSEGAGVIVLESLNSAEKRGAEVYGELVGFGASYANNDAENKHKQGFHSKISCIKQALESASIDPKDVDYINASGISGMQEDREESEVIKSVFGENIHKISVSSTKGSIGFSIGASGPIDAIFSLLSLKKQVLPQTNNLENIDPECNSINILKKPEFKSVNTILSNNFDYAGNNISLLFKRV
ncbi:MAG: beta-ketoacyl-[acyl-carrier-protein] synthase family protein [Candidatus Brocadia sp.]|nr:beta-ketoacyl-[acyl-carrier-protein] synthase family protein [Candidatus Brocadia sp.]